MGTRYRGSAKEVRALDAYIKLQRASDTLEQFTQRRLADCGMSLSQLGVLEALLHLGSLSQKEIGRKILRSGGSVTSVIDTLEGKGWVRRERSAEDRRMIHLHLTAEGRRRIRRVFPRHAANIVEAMGALTAGEQEELGRLCRKLGRAVPADE